MCAPCAAKRRQNQAGKTASTPSSGSAQTSTTQENKTSSPPKTVLKMIAGRWRRVAV